MTVGTTSALDIALRMFTTRGDSILMEEYAFYSSIESAIPLGVNCVSIPMDDQGILPASLDAILTNWDPQAHAGGRKPWLLYIVPTGRNATGATQGL